jgi:hypothetical protein
MYVYMHVCVDMLGGGGGVCVCVFRRPMKIGVYGMCGSESEAKVIWDERPKQRQTTAPQPPHNTHTHTLSLSRSLPPA